MKLKQEINRKINKINKTKSLFFEKINKIYKALARLAEKKEKRGYKLLITEIKERISLQISCRLK